MPLTPREIRRYARQLALPAVGAVGMARVRAARVVVFSEGGANAAPFGEASETAALYLSAAGVGEVNVRGRPEDHAGWSAALAGQTAAVRFALDDDALLSAAAEHAVPLVLARVAKGGIDLLSFRRSRTCGHPLREQQGGSSERDADAGAAAVVAGTLAASEVLWLIIDPERQPNARLCRLGLQRSEASEVGSAELPWPPPCPVCARTSNVPFS